MCQIREAELVTTERLSWITIENSTRQLSRVSVSMLFQALNPMVTEPLQIPINSVA